MSSPTSATVAGGQVSLDELVRCTLGAVSLLLLGSCANDEAEPELGSAVGLRARVHVDGGELVSAEAEIRLDPPGATRSATLRSATSTMPPQLFGPHMLPGQPAPIQAPLQSTPPADAAACGVGQPAAQIGTIDGSICWVSSSLTSGALFEENALYEFVFFGREGIYKATQVSLNVYYPPDFGHFGVNTSVGCAKSPDGDVITTQYLGSMSQLAVSYGMGPFICGFSAFIAPGRGFVSALEYDTGYGLTASLIPWPSGVSLNLMEEATYTTPPTLIATWGDGCGALEPRDSAGYRAGEEGTLATIAAGLRGLQAAPGDDTTAVLGREMASSLLPVFDMLATPSGGAPSDDAPAVTQADLFAAWLAHGGGDSLCADCPAMSIDHLLYELDRQVRAAGNDSEAILLAGIEAADRQVQISPQLLEQAVLTRRLSPGVALAGVLAEEVVSGDDPKRFIDPRIVVVSAELGVSADLSITAEEIAELLEVDAAALAGATITIDASPVVEPASFVLSDGEVQAGFVARDSAPVLFRYDVDLSTAVGPLPAGAEAWVVRPAMRQLEPAAGPPAHVLLAAPYRARAGEPIVLSAMVLDADYGPVDTPVDVEFLDGADALLTTAEGQAGVAQTTLVPTPTIPVVTEVRPTTLEYGDDSTGPGFIVTGSGFSREAEVWVDNQRLADRGLIVAVNSSHEILFEDDDGFGGPHTLVVVNPHGTSGDGVRFTGP